MQKMKLREAIEDNRNSLCNTPEFLSADEETVGRDLPVTSEQSCLTCAKKAVENINTEKVQDFPLDLTMPSCSCNSNEKSNFSHVADKKQAQSQQLEFHE